MTLLLLVVDFADACGVVQLFEGSVRKEMFLLFVVEPVFAKWAS